MGALLRGLGSLGNQGQWGPWASNLCQELHQLILSVRL